MLLVTSASADIPYPAALDAAAVRESWITDLNRDALVLGNGDLNALLWERNGALCLRVAKNDIWDARVDTSGKLRALNPWTGEIVERETESGETVRLAP